MSNEQRNMIIAIALSLVVVFGWQFLIVRPQLDQQQARNSAEQTQAQAQQENLPTPGSTSQASDIGTPASAGTPVFEDRATAVAHSPRVKIDTPSLAGSINLTGARIDDLELKDYHETVDQSSPIISLLNPEGAPDAYFAEQGWTNVRGGKLNIPDTKTQWTAEPDAVLTPSSPVTLSWDNGEGLVFSRTISVDSKYLFTVKQSVQNQSGDPVTLYPFARVQRDGTPQVQNFFVQHEGPLGVLGDNNLVSRKYGDVEKAGQEDFSANGGWIGITDKYWATTVLSEPGQPINARFSWSQPGDLDIYRMSYVGSDPVSVQPGATGANTSYVFAGAKEESVIASYEEEPGFDRLELLIDWGWLFFFTKPLFHLLTFLYGFLGNFGLAILAVTVIVKAIFFPLANRSYASMAKMRKVQPEMKVLQERYKDDRAELQKATMELYKQEKINPLSGCWPILIQIPVFYSLYTVLFISLEMRHAPFFGWIQDLASPDPTHILNLFGLLPYDPSTIPMLGTFLAIGIWPLIMGITMWVQMRLNPPPPDPTQAMIFSLMPIVFTFMLGRFPAGLVIYWAWNNFLSICQQYIIMRRNGADVNLWGNVLSSLGIKRKQAADKPSN